MNNIDLISDDGCIKQLLTNDFSNTNGSYIDDSIKRVGDYAFYGCSELISVDFPVATSIGDYAFHSCSKLTSVDFPVATSVGDYAFYGCSELISVDFPVATSIGVNAFYTCSKLTSVDFPVATSIGANAFSNCSELTSVDFPVATSIVAGAFYTCSKLTSVDFPVATSIGANAFSNCSELISLILRKSDAICTLANVNALQDTPIRSGTGYIYVPRALVDTYKAASNWSTCAAQFRALEDYTVDGTITGDLDPNKI